MSKFTSTKPISAVVKSDKRKKKNSYWTSATTTKRNLGLEILKKSFNCKIVYKERYRERQGDEDTKTPKPTSTVHRHGEQPPGCSSLRRSLKLLLLSLFAFWECLNLEINCFCPVNKEGCCTVHRFLWRRVPGESPHVPPPPFTIKGLVCTAILQKILLLLLMQLLDSGRSVQAFVSVCLKKAMKVVLLPPNILILLLPISIHKSFLTQFFIEIFGKCIVNTLILLFPISIHKNFLTQFLVEIFLANGFFGFQKTTDSKLETPNSGKKKILKNNTAAVAARKNPHERRRRRSKHVAASSTAMEFCTKY